MILKGVKPRFYRGCSFFKSKKGQVAIFIILAILIVALSVLFFVFKDALFKNKQTSEVSSIYNSFVTCLRGDLAQGVNVIESQGGYIYLPDYEKGSEYMPFSSQLDFLGNPIPYWYYVSGNNIQKEQVPSKKDMQQELERFINTHARGCLFDEYYSQGYNIVMGNPDASITILDNKVSLDLKMDFSIKRGEESFVAREHKITLNSQLGSLYDSAIKVYEEEQKGTFLENYSIDVLRLYAPVDGVDITCAPETWNAINIFNTLREALEANILALKGKNTKKDYFDVKIPNLPSKQKVRFLNSQNWTYTFEVNPSDGPIMVADPVGNQQGLGIIGFCYVPYHFVYSMKFPVLVQVVSGETASEIFQFPVAVVIERNVAREVSGGEALSLSDEELCKDKNTPMNISIFDASSRPVDGYISYECAGAKCNIGATHEGVLSGLFPQCVNGFVDVKADGYKDESVMYSTVRGGSMSLYLSKIYNMSVQLMIDNRAYNREAVLNFVSDDYSTVVYYPIQKSVQLPQGEYEVQVYVYKNSTLKLGATTQQQCVTVPMSSVLGAIGLTKKQCYDVQVPSQMISQALSAGGKANYTFSEGQLRNSRVIAIYASSLPDPSSLEQIQTNYMLFDSNPLEIKTK